MTLKGSWDNWETDIAIKNNHVFLKIVPGIYYFKFIVDGNWTVDQELMTCEDNNGILNNIIKIKVSLIIIVKNKKLKLLFRYKLS